MTVSAFASFALLAVVMPHVHAAPAPAVAASAVRSESHAQAYQRLKFLGVSSPGHSHEATATEADAASKGGTEISRMFQARRGHSAADVRPGLLRAAPFSATAPVPVPTPASLAVVAPGPGFFGFPGLTHRDQRLAGTGVYANTQFSLEPPDQGLCVGNGFVMEGVNNALAVFTKQGTRVAGPTAFSEFFHLAPEINRSAQPHTYGPFLSDPRCSFDSDTQRWFVTELEMDQNLVGGAPTGQTALLLAVSQTADPNGAYSLYEIDTTNASGPNCPCFGDQPLLGADANGIYISTNEFPVVGPGFNGAQVYALSKRALAAGILPTVVHMNLGALPTPDKGQLWYSVQPAKSPDATQQNGSRNGTELFLSALQFTGVTDDRIAVWALSNTRSLDNATPNLALQHVVIRSLAYGAPVPANQKPGPTPLGTSLGAPLESINSNDDRMNQVVYAGGRLWSGVNTIVRFGSVETNGIAYFVVAPHIAPSGSLSASMTAGGYVAVRGENVLYPSIGVNSRGMPLMAFTLVGPHYFPSAAYVTESAGRISNVQLAGPGSAPDDGFTGYPPNGSVGRWGDYSAAVADRDGSLWFAAEYIPNAPRTALTNWGTFIGHVPAP